MKRARLIYLPIITIFAALAALMMPRPVLAVDVCQEANPGGEAGDDLPDEPAEVTGGCDSVASTLKYYLLQAGYDENAAAGLMGNISAESCGYKHTVYKNCNTLAPDGFHAYILGSNGSYTLNSAMSPNDGFGLVQWTHDNNPSRDRLLRLQKYADGEGKYITDLEIQIEFILAETTTNKYGTYYSNVLKPEALNGRSLEDVTWRVLKWYEAPASVRGSPGYGAVSQVCTDADSSWCKSFKKRLGRAQEAKNISGNCNPTTSGDSEDPGSSDPGDSGGTSDYSGPTEVPVVPTTPQDQGPTTSGSTDGALGKQSSSGMVGQYDSGIKDVVWRRDGSTVSASGCSLVSVVNAARALGHSQSQTNVSSLASWSKSNISSASWDNLKLMARHVGLSASSWLWTSKSTSDSVKIQKIRDTLASGGVVIAGGDRAGTDSSFCTSARKASGECTFTPGGHFVAFIGITADNKLVVANPGKANNRTWIFPASNVLKYSNKAIMVK